MTPLTVPQILHLLRELQIECRCCAIYNIDRIDELPWVGLWQAPDFFRNFEAYKDGYPDDCYIVITSPLTGKRLFATNYDPLSGLIDMMNTCFLVRAVACEYWREGRVAMYGPQQDSCGDLEDEVIPLDELIEVLGLWPDVGTTHGWGQS